MCSISGIISIANLVGARVDLSEVVGRMNSALRHRGPDDKGIASVGFRVDNTPATIVLGNTRLAIIDTSVAGHQPMHDPDTGNWITYNGETYNFRELRKEIGDEFGPWRSNTDTEVVLRAYRKWGSEAFGKLRGMFALAIWDQQKQELVLARDRFGIKPLYYFNATSDQNHSVIFASEVRALLASNLVPRRLSATGVRSFLEYGSVQAPLTIVEGVQSLMPGECLFVRGDSSTAFRLEFTSFATTKQFAEKPESQAEAKAQLRSLLEDSVRQHLVSDVPVGVFLSGGMDSSAIVGLMSRVSSEPPKTFSVVFNELEFNEAHHSRLVAKTFKTNHCEVTLTEQSLLADIPKAISALDQPSMDGINTYLVSKAVKNAGITVALSGLGGDELFGGYPSFRRALKFQSANWLAKQAFKAIAPIGQISSNGLGRQAKFWQLAGTDCAPTDVYRITRQLFSPKAVIALGKVRTESHATLKTDSNSTDTVNLVSKLELEGYMANTLLRDTDAMSMAHSLEVRVPFVDMEVAAFVLNLPGKWKLNGTSRNVPKPLLADVLSDLFSMDMLLRKKMGFTLPFEKWLGSDLRSEVSEVFTDTNLLGNAGINKSAAENVWNRFLRQPKDVGWSRPWSLFVLARWCENNQVTI